MTMTIRRPGTRARDDAGVSMAELLVYCLLLGGVLILVGSLLINSLRTERTVSTVVDATTAAQLVTRSLETQIRNSSGFTVETVGASDQLLRARVSDEDGAYRCVAWYYSNAEGTIRTTSSDLKIPATKWGTASALGEWTLLAEGVEPAVDKPAATPVLASSAGNMLKIDFRVLAGDHPPATISSSVATRVTEASTQCW